MPTNLYQERLETRQGINVIIASITRILMRRELVSMGAVLTGALRLVRPFFIVYRDGRRVKLAAVVDHYLILFDNGKVAVIHSRQRCPDFSVLHCVNLTLL